MFLSAESRKKAENSVVLPDQISPKGEAFSPYVLSLWDAPHSHANVSIQDSPCIVSKKSIKTQEISENSSSLREKSEKIKKAEDFSVHTLAESEIKVPSREDQIAKVKKAMSQFEELSQSSKKRGRSENSGFFRNLRKLI